MAESISDPDLGLIWSGGSGSYMLADQVTSVRLHGWFHVNCHYKPGPSALSAQAAAGADSPAAEAPFPIEKLRAQVAWLEAIPEAVAVAVEQGLYDYYLALYREVSHDPTGPLRRTPRLTSPGQCWQVFRPANARFDLMPSPRKYDASLNFESSWDREHRVAAMFKGGHLIRVGDEGVE